MHGLFETTVICFSAIKDYFSQNKFHKDDHNQSSSSEEWKISNRLIIPLDKNKSIQMTKLSSKMGNHILLFSVYNKASILLPIRICRRLFPKSTIYIIYLFVQDVFVHSFISCLCVYLFFIFIFMHFLMLLIV